MAGVLVYSNSLNAPFVFDDHPHVTKNKSIRAWKKSPYQITKIRAIWKKNVKTRFFPFLSLAHDFFLHQKNVKGYHVANIILHILNAFWVYFLVSLLFKTPKLADIYPARAGPYVAGLSSLIFLCHPLQTSTVTYIVQRMSLLAAFFYLGTLVFYLKARLTSHGFFDVLAFLMGLAAMFCKEISFTLPVALLMMTWLCFGFERTPKKMLAQWGPFGILLIIIPVLILQSKEGLKLVEDVLLPLPKHAVSRGDYFLTELNVLCTYLRLFFFPVSQNADYDYPISRSLIEPKTLVCFLFLAALFLFAVRFRERNRLISFSIFWFFLTLSVESSVIPIVDVIVEYRMYLPLVGCAIFLSAVLYSLFKKTAYFLAVGIVITLVFSGMSYARNQVWQSSISFWEDVIRKSPNKARGYNNLGAVYNHFGKQKEAWKYFEMAFEKNPRVPEVYKLGVAREHEGKIEEAIVLYQKSVEWMPRFFVAYDRLGLAYQKVGNIEKAIESFENVLRINPRYAAAYKHLGMIAKNRGERQKAVWFFKKALQLNPKDTEPDEELRKIYFRIEE